jgi:hypothetical protein
MDSHFMPEPDLPKPHRRHRRKAHALVRIKNAASALPVVAATLASPAPPARAQEAAPVNAMTIPANWAGGFLNNTSVQLLGGGLYVPSISLPTMNLTMGGYGAGVKLTTPTVMEKSVEARVVHRLSDSDFAIYGSLSDTNLTTGSVGITVTKLSGVPSFSIPGTALLPTNAADYVSGVVTPQLPGTISIQSVGAQLNSPAGYTFTLPSVSPQQAAIAGILYYNKDLPALLDKYGIKGSARAQILNATANPQNIMNAVDAGFSAAHKADADAQKLLDKANAATTTALNLASAGVGKAAAATDATLTQTANALDKLVSKTDSGLVAGDARLAAGSQSLTALALKMPAGPGRDALLKLAQSEGAATSIGAGFANSKISGLTSALTADAMLLKSLEGKTALGQADAQAAIEAARKVQSKAFTAATGVLTDLNNGLTLAQNLIDTPIPLGRITLSAKSPEMQALTAFMAKNNLGTINVGQVFDNAIHDKPTTITFTQAQLTAAANQLVKDTTSIKVNADMKKAEIGGIYYPLHDSSLYVIGGAGLFTASGSVAFSYPGMHTYTQTIGNAFNTSYSGLVGLAGDKINLEKITFIAPTKNAGSANVRVVGGEVTVGLGTDLAQDGRNAGFKWIPNSVGMPVEASFTGGLGTVTSETVTGLPSSVSAPNLKGKLVPVGSFRVLGGISYTPGQ